MLLCTKNENETGHLSPLFSYRKSFLKPSNASQLKAITIFNLVIVGCSPVFALGGDGGGYPALKDMLLILGIAVVWVLGCAYHAYKIASNGNENLAFWIASLTLPCGLSAFMFLIPLWELFKAVKG